MLYNRFLNVARYNLIINRAHYMKMALSLFLVMALPFLMFIMKTIWMMGLTKSVDYALSATVPGTNMGSWMMFSFLFVMPIICGYTFHNLLTKQSRIRELTLPATNGEKFLFHALITVGGAFLAYVVFYFLIDLLQFLYVGMLFNFDRAEFFPYTSIFFTTPEELRNSISPMTSVWLGIIANLAMMAYFSTFILGNALKYRHNVLWTYVFHIVLGFVSMICLGMSMPVIIGMNWEWLANIDGSQAELLIKIVGTIFFSLVIAFCWWMSYRLYCRAQITTLRNK